METIRNKKCNPLQHRRRRLHAVLEGASVSSLMFSFPTSSFTPFRVFLITFLSCVMLQAAAATNVPSSPTFATHNHVQYFGFYRDTVSQTAPFTNLRISVKTPTEANEAAALNLSSFFFVHGTFFDETTKDLYDDWKDRWAALEPVAADMLANETIIGFNLGDEVVWNCFPIETVHTVSNTLRASFPDAVIWYNEAVGPVVHNTMAGSCGNYTPFNFTLPKSMSWFSVDKYHKNGFVEGWVEDNVRTLYEDSIYPLLTPEQKVLLVPGAFGSDHNYDTNGTMVCDRECYEYMCSRDALDFVQWAKEDTRVVGITPWNWYGCPLCPPEQHIELGTENMTLLRATWGSVGRSIIKGEF